MHEEANEQGSSLDGAKPRRKTPRVGDYLGDMSPNQRAHEKAEMAVQWVYEWGVTTDALLCQVVGQERRGYASFLTTKGLLVRTPTESGGFQRGVPKYFYTLSEAGVAAAERHALPLRYPELNTGKVVQRLLRHNLVAQQITCDLMPRLVGQKYFSERRLATRMAGKLKRPDAVVVMHDHKIAVEIELSAKWDRDLDQFISGMIALLAEEDESSRVDGFIILSDSKAIIERYKQAIQPGTQLRLWEKDQMGKWVNRRFFEIEPDFCKKVGFYYLPDWESVYRDS